MRGSFSNEIIETNRKAAEREALKKTRVEVEAASARLANALNLSKQTRGGFIAELNSAYDLVTKAIIILDEKLINP